MRRTAAPSTPASSTAASPTPVLLALALLLAGCSGDDPAPRASSSPSSAAPSSVVPPSASATPSPTATRRPLREGPPRLRLVARFDDPVYVGSPPGDERLFVVEQPGRIRIVRGGRTVPAPFLDISRAVGSGGERGMFSVAFPPDFARSGLLYVNFTDTSGAVRLAEFRVSGNPDRADAASRRDLLTIPKPYSNHNGGRVAFDPSGKLLLSIGDGGAGGDPDNRAQDLGDLLGKILRIDPRPSGGRPYGIPPDNPFVGRSGARPEVWAYGLRNPWRFSFDTTGDLYVGDVGQGKAEEISVVPPARQSGANYGWRLYEGRDRYTAGTPNPAGPLIVPVHQYDHGGGRCSVSAGLVYRGTVAALHGRFLFGDYCSGELWSFVAGTADRPAVAKLPFDAAGVASFGEDADGEGYVVSAHGEVWELSV